MYDSILQVMRQRYIRERVPANENCPCVRFCVPSFSRTIFAANFRMVAYAMVTHRAQPCSGRRGRPELLSWRWLVVMRNAPALFRERLQLSLTGDVGLEAAAITQAKVSREFVFRLVTKVGDRTLVTETANV